MAAIVLAAMAAAGVAAETRQPQNVIVRVASPQQLQAALLTLRANTRVELAPGRYQVPDAAFYLPQGIGNVTIAGATGRRDDVVVHGDGLRGAARFAFWIDDVAGATIQDLTIVQLREHGVIVNCHARAPILRNVRMVDIGDQFLKVNPGDGPCGVDDGIVEDSLFEYSTSAPDDYTNAIDVHFGKRWIVRRNTFRNFVRPGGLVGPAVLFWNGAADTIIENNTFVDNARDIALGLMPTKTGEPPIRNSKLTDHQGGRVTGNVITRRPGLTIADVAISVADSPGTIVERNRIAMHGSYPFAIEYRFPRTDNVVIRENELDAGIRARDGAEASVSRSQASD
jgi:hypothetical protein